MGCFLACFGSSKDKSRRNQQRYRVQHREQRYTSFEPVQSAVSSVPVWENPISPELKYEKPISPELKCEKPINPELKDEKPISVELKEEKPRSPELEEVRDKPVEQLSFITRKKVTFDSNVQTYEHVAINESTDLLFDSKECQKEEGKTLKESSQSKTSSEDGSITSSSGSYPPNHRYQNCRDSDDEDEPLDYDEDSDLDDDDLEDDTDDNGELEYEDEIVDSKRGTQVMTEDSDSAMPKKPTGLNYSARDRSGYVHAVLNPVENLTQWKAVKAKKTTVMKPQKENFTLADEPRISFSSEPSFKEVSSSFKSLKRQSGQARNSNQEMAVDASLSNWLGSSEATPVNKTSTISLDTATPEKSMSYGSPHSATSHEDRPILGALTVEELRQFSASSSPRKSPSRSPDEIAIIGTVGSYWNDHTGPAKGSGASSYKGIPNTTSKYREDRRVNWHSTPFETRLERALNRGAADAYSSSRTPHGL
ncbi:eisosome protein SEG2 [Rosa rugosa]|uniref:eisosome protein SEG2 n=1 Tax=Rosa rugosa TaxID=74645 RepID=UPI002B40C4A8|nr:eisosome protein SEG2 [Rosa rugosa]